MTDPAQRAELPADDGPWSTSLQPLAPATFVGVDEWHGSWQAGMAGKRKPL